MIAIGMVAAMTGCGGADTTSTQDESVENVKEETATAQTTEETNQETVVSEEVATEEPITEEPITEEPTTLSGPVEITITTVGSMYFDDAIVSACGEIGYDYLFEDVKDFISESDIAVGTIQTPLPVPAYFDIGTSLANAGFDAIDVSTVNCLDSNDVDGLNKTMMSVFSANMQTFGAYTNANPYDKIAYIEVKGVKVAFIAGAQNIASEADTVDINTIDEAVLISQIDEAKANGANAVVVFLNYPSDVMGVPEEFAQKLTEAGADLMIGTGMDYTIVGRKTLRIDGNASGLSYSSLGDFLDSNDEIAVITRHHIVINENGEVNMGATCDADVDMAVAGIDKDDHYKLVLLTPDNVNYDAYSDDAQYIIKDILK